mmetsp:Transcript_12974/g.32757  ORF Transcript_12974/g.32757 Transcript_12974/m.32757 type:complete len:321 (+) Transcript_12974:171-1133(+)
MLLQERNYRLYYDDELDDEVKNRALSTPVGSSERFSSTKTQKNSSKNRLRRSTFDLSSVSSMSTVSSDSSSCCLSSPTRKSSTLRYRGPSSFTSSTCGNSILQEGAASEALMQLIKNSSKSSLHDLRENYDETQGQRDSGIRKASSTTAVSASQSSDMDSFMEYFLEVIVFGCVVVPLLHLTIRMERYFRSTFGDIHRNAGFVLASVCAPSSSIRQEPINFESKGLYRSREDFYGTCEATSSSSSSSDDNSEEDEDGWGHFADFRDELADEASFIPSCSMMALRQRSVTAVAVTPSCATTLETLAEGREEEDEAEEDWSF